MTWAVLALLGGVVALDATSFPQSMICRPLIAGGLTGLAFGRPAEGLLLGLLMEVFSLVILPIGAARYPESGTATVAAVGGYMTATAVGPDPALLVLGLAFGLAWENLTGATVIALRRRTGRTIMAEQAPGPEDIPRLHLGAMTLDFVRGTAMTVVGALVGHLALRLLGGYWGLPEPATVSLLTLLVVAMLGTAATLFAGGSRSRAAFAAGLGGGAALALVAL